MPRELRGFDFIIEITLYKNTVFQIDGPADRLFRLFIISDKAIFPAMLCGIHFMRIPMRLLATEYVQISKRVVLLISIFVMDDFVAF